MEQLDLRLPRRQRAEMLTGSLLELLQAPGVTPCFPLGPLLPTPHGSPSIRLDPGAASLPQRALLFMLLLSVLPKTHTRQRGERQITEEVSIGPLAQQFRQNLLDWFSHQDPEHPAVQVLIQAEPQVRVLALPLALERLVGEDPITDAAWMQIFLNEEMEALAEQAMERLLSGITRSFEDSYKQTLETETGTKKSVAREAKRFSEGAYRRDNYYELQAATAEPLSPAQVQAVSDALEQPFGGRRLLAALFFKLVLNHLCLFAAAGKPSPSTALIQERALWVLNATAALDTHPWALAAATVAAALRRQLSIDPKSVGADVMLTLPSKVVKLLPPCFKREQLHHPKASYRQARKALLHARGGIGLPYLETLRNVAGLARMTAGLMQDMLSSSALGLEQAQHGILADRFSNLNVGGKNSKLKAYAPGDSYRIGVLLPQFHRVSPYYALMERAGAIALQQVRERLHRELQWPAVPNLAAHRAPVSGSSL